MTNKIELHKKWHVVVSKNIHHRKAAAVLEKLGFIYYLPLQRQLHYWSDRKRWIDIPIFNPYVFLFTNEVDRNAIFQSCSFFHFLICAGKLITVQEEEIEKVKLLCNYSSDMRIEQQSIKKGDCVEVTSGPFSGMNGYIIQENGKHRLMVQIASLGRFASVGIESNWLRLCS